MIITRLLTQSDSQTYRFVRLECLKNHPENFGTLFDEENKNPQLVFEKYLNDPSSENFMFGSFDGDICVGICGFVKGKRIKTKHRGEIVQMYVNEMYSGKGIGKELLIKAIEKAFENSEIEQLVLSVVLSNKGANKLYEQVGFVEYGIIRNYFKLDNRKWDQRFMILERENFNYSKIINCK